MRGHLVAWRKGQMRSSFFWAERADAIFLQECETQRSEVQLPEEQIAWGYGSIPVVIDNMQGF
ncbi:MAG: hypothetical protein EA364_04425 [Balneolaceae bacterium]|nr:MAG: hypothetical protein EA364_04425 [Balneolaceae bacterium]